MKTKEIINIIIGIVVGTGLGLFLTLYLWGGTWWQIVISIFSGAIAGCVIADYKLSWKMGQQSYTTSQNMLKNLVNTKTRKERKKVNVRKLIYAVHNWILFLLYLFTTIVILILILILIAKIKDNLYEDLAIFAGAFIGVGNIAVISNILFFRKTIVKMVNLNKSVQVDNFSSLSDADKDYVTSLYTLEHLSNEGLPLAKFFKRLWVAKFWDAVYMTEVTLKLTINLVISCIFLPIMLAIIPFVLLKNLLSQNKFLFVFIGVTVGIMSGVLSNNLLLDKILIYHIILGMISGAMVVLPAIILHYTNENMAVKNTFPIKIMDALWNNMSSLGF